MVSSYIESRPYLERTYSCEEDDGLIGLLSLCISILQHNPPFKISTEGQVRITQVYPAYSADPRFLIYVLGNWAIKIAIL